MATRSPAGRLRGLPTVTVFGFEVPMATGLSARFLGLALLDREDAGPGLMIPRCRSVHTFGMRFALDVVFLDEARRPLAVRHDVPARRVVSHRRASAVLELPAGGLRCSAFSAKSDPEGGEFLSRAP